MLRSGLRTLLANLPKTSEPVQTCLPAYSMLLQRAFADAPAAAAGKPIVKLTDIPMPTWDAKLDEWGDAIKSEDAKREWNKLRSIFVDVQRKYQQALEGGKKSVDWESFKSTVDPDLVDAFKAEIDRMAAVPIDQKVIQEYVAKAGEAEKRMKADMAKLAEDCKVRIEELKKEIAKIDTEMALIDHLTMDQALAMDPEIAKEVDKDISEGKWY